MTPGRKKPNKRRNKRQINSKSNCSGNDTESSNHNPDEKDTASSTHNPDEKDTASSTHNPDEKDTASSTQNPYEKDLASSNHNPDEKDTGNHEFNSTDCIKCDVIKDYGGKKSGARSENYPNDINNFEVIEIETDKINGLDDFVVIPDEIGSDNFEILEMEDCKYIHEAVGGDNPGAAGGDNPGAAGGDNPGAAGGDNPGAVGGDNPCVAGGSNQLEMNISEGIVYYRRIIQKSDKEEIAIYKDNR